MFICTLVFTKETGRGKEGGVEGLLDWTKTDVGYIAVNKRIISALMKMCSIQLEIQNSSSKEIYIWNTDLDTVSKMMGRLEE